MVDYVDENQIKLSGDWSAEQITPKIEKLTDIIQVEFVAEKPVIIDCNEVVNVDKHGLQLLYVWLQCLSFRGARPAIVGISVSMRAAIRQCGLEKFFSGFRLFRR